MTTGEKIAALRRETGLSQEALADKLGISRQAVSKWEADQAVPSMDNLMELGRIFSVPVDTLLRPDGVLPGKTDGAEGKAEADDPKAVLSPGGYTISYKPVLTKKTKAFIIVLALLLAAAVMCNTISLVWLSRLQREVDLIPRGSNTVYVPSPDSGTPEPSDIADYSLDYDLAPDDPNKLLLKLSAMPREVDAEETAQFSIRGGEESIMVDAVMENGYYIAETLFPLEDDISIYLLLTRGGATRNLQVDMLWDLREMFGMRVELKMENGGLGWSMGRGWLTGQLVVKVASPSGEVYPVSGRVVLYVDGEEYDSVPIGELAARREEWLDPNMADATMYYRVELPWNRIDTDDIEAVTWSVELTDNLGRVTEYDEVY